MSDPVVKGQSGSIHSGKLGFLPLQTKKVSFAFGDGVPLGGHDAFSYCGSNPLGIGVESSPVGHSFVNDLENVCSPPTSVVRGSLDSVDLTELKGNFRLCCEALSIWELLLDKRLPSGTLTWV